MITIALKGEANRIQTSIKTAKNSVFLKTLIEEFPEESNFELPSNMNFEILESIINYLEYLESNTEIKEEIQNREIPQPIPNNTDLNIYLTEYEISFLKRFDGKMYELFDYMKAVDFLEIDCLLEILSAKTATIARHFDSETFMEVFQIESDMTDAEVKTLESGTISELQI